MINLPNVTLFCISSNKVDGALYALKKSMEGINFGSVKLITHKLPDNLPEDIEYSQCYEITSMSDYNYYCIYNLTNHIETDYCLLVQPDGYVIRPHLWDNDWFNYDYIGAPWRIEDRSFITPFNEHIQVGNGGFSFRSKKLLEVPKQIEIPWDVNQGNFYKHFNYGSTSEDGNICVHNRHLYESQGCKFAPLNVAVKFSKEREIPENVGMETFGFHYYFQDIR
jgi:hypothetical protein